MKFEKNMMVVKLWLHETKILLYGYTLRVILSPFPPLKEAFVKRF